jgi:signal peptidase II
MVINKEDTYDSFNKGKLVSYIIINGIIIDQITKYFVRLFNPNMDFKIFKIILAKNTGSAFSLFSGKNFILALVTLVFITIFLFYSKKIMLEKDYFAYFLIFTGAVGNLIDRLFLGYVTDMISIASFPIFNIADSMITIGAVIIIYNAIKQEINKKKNK